jgi:predicted Zn-dependent peptidase
VQAGSVDEAEDQRGLAHVLEHMAFNGTARFKPGELVNYLQSIGAASARTSTPTRATTRRSTCSTSRPIGPTRCSAGSTR